MTLKPNLSPKILKLYNQQKKLNTSIQNNLLAVDNPSCKRIKKKAQACFKIGSITSDITGRRNRLITVPNKHKMQ